MKMTMNYEFISPEKAKLLLETNTQNRSLSKLRIQAYAQDMLMGNWDENVGDVISIDEDGILRNGQHRLWSIVKSGVGIHTWICRNVSSNGIYDNNRKRSNSDQISIVRPDFENFYKSTQYCAIARSLIANITNGHNRRPVTAKEIIDFTENHKEDLDGFFLKLPWYTYSKISIAVVKLSLFMAYMSKVDIDNILKFYEILCLGMSTKQEEFPVIAYRNYLKDSSLVTTTHEEIGRCQWALKKYLSGSCVRSSRVPKELIYPFPYQKLA